MDQKKWQLVYQNYQETEYLTDGYYRLRETADGYKLAFLTAGFCGEKVIHPELTIQLIKGQAVPIALLDLGATPIKRLDQTNQAELEQAAEALLQKFCQAKKLTAEDD